MAEGRRPRAILETSGAGFSNTDRPRPANKVFNFFFYGIALKGPNMSKIFVSIIKLTFGTTDLVIESIIVYLKYLHFALFTTLLRLLRLLQRA